MRVNICGIPHEVIEKEDNFGTLVNAFGMIDYDKAEIYVNTNANPAIKYETICHEMVHGMLIHIGRNDLSADETFVQALGNAICQGFVFVDLDRPRREITLEEKERIIKRLSKLKTESEGEK